MKSAKERDNEQDDQKFIEDLYQEYQLTMYRTAVRITGDSDVASDLVQDALVKLIEKISTLQTLTGCILKAYVVYTVRNISFNYNDRKSVRKKHIIALDADAEDKYSDNQPSMDELMIAAENRECFRESFSKIPKEDQTLLVGKYVLGLSDQELAKEFSCKPASIRMKLTRAKRRTMQHFQKEAETIDKI